MKKALLCLTAAATFAAQAKTLQSYDLIPQLRFSHDLSGCQYFYEKPTEEKNGELKVRIFETCDWRNEQRELLGDFSYTSKIDWYIVRCSAQTVAWTNEIRFDRQFWRGPGEISGVKEVRNYDFQRPHDLLSDLFKRVCDPSLRGAPTT